jgi:hypothetical protein
MGDEGLQSVGVTPPFPGTLAGYFLTRPGLCQDNRIAQKRGRGVGWRDG